MTNPRNLPIRSVPVRHVALAVALLASALVVAPMVARAAVVTVRITHTLEPSTVTVVSGDTVRWVNEDGERHRPRSVSGPEEFDTGNLEPGESASVTFTATGTYRYRDERDREATTYHGTIVVEAGSGTGGSTGSSTGSATGGTGEQPPPSAQVQIVDRGYSPPTVTIRAGGAVTWTNTDDREHTVTASDRSWDSGSFDAGQTYTRTFPDPGTVQYFCVLHPDMQGVVSVQTSDGGPPPPPEPTPPPTPAPSPTIPGVPATADHVVVIRDAGFTPPTLTVAEGQDVAWINTGIAPHTVTAADGSFESGTLETADTFTIVFATAGTYPYLCALHPSYMTGEITVTAAAPA